MDVASLKGVGAILFGTIPRHRNDFELHQAQLFSIASIDERVLLYSLRAHKNQWQPSYHALLEYKGKDALGKTRTYLYLNVNIQDSNRPNGNQLWWMDYLRNGLTIDIAIIKASMSFYKESKNFKAMLMEQLARNRGILIEGADQAFGEWESTRDFVGTPSPQYRRVLEIGEQDQKDFVFGYRNKARIVEF